MAAAGARAEQRKVAGGDALEQLEQPLVARAVHVRRAEDRERYLRRGRQLADHPLRGHLGALVDVAWPERRPLRGDARRPVAVDADGAAVDEALDPSRTGRVEQPAGALEVHRLEELVALPALAHGDGQVERVGHAPHGARAQLRVGDAARQDLHALLRQQLGVGALLRPIGETQHHDLRPPPPSLLRQVRPDEPGSARDQQSHPKRSASAATIRSVARPSP